jgi:carbon storage regulator
MVGDEVEITIVDVRGDKVRLGITAPRSIAVHRKEVYNAIQREKAEAEAGKETPKETPKEKAHHN